MSKWITDRLPTGNDGYPIDDMGYYGRRVWCIVQGRAEIIPWRYVQPGDAWQPIVIEKPQIWVPEPKYYAKFWLAEQLGEQNRWSVYCNVGGIQADNLPTQEAAERIAAIYNEVMP